MSSGKSSVGEFAKHAYASHNHLDLEHVQYECIKSELRDDYERRTKNSIKKLLIKGESDPSIRLLNKLAPTEERENWT